MKYNVPEHILHSKLDKEVVILNLKNGEYYSLNETGALVWELVCSGMSSEDIAREFSEQFSRTVPDSRSDTKEFLEELEQNGLVEEI